MIMMKITVILMSMKMMISVQCGLCQQGYNFWLFWSERCSIKMTDMAFYGFSFMFFLSECCSV